jgi:4-amino-4-deoxy-L-arabinose transferase-like glycosyltransferase
MKRLGLAEAIVLLVAAGLFFARLGVNELGSADEAVHAQVAREMSRDGHWLYPTCRGEPYFEKPPLKLWLTAITFRVAGESDFTARLWSAVFALGTVWGVMRLGSLLFNRVVGVGAGLALATTWEFLFKHCARTGEMDSGMLFFTVMAVIALWQLRVDGRPSRMYAAAVWMALGILTKGHVVLIPLLWLALVWRIRPAGAAAWSRSDWIRHGSLATLLFLAIAAPWFGLQVAHYGSLYGRHLLLHNLTGYLRGTVENAETTVWYYFEEVLRLDYPWPPLMVVGALFCMSRRITGDFPHVRAARAWLFAWIGMMMVLLFFSKTKLPWYHLPSLLPASILAGLALERWWNAVPGAATTGWYRLWVALHITLLLLISGTWGCLREWFIAWRQGDRSALGDFGYYYFLSPSFRSFPMAVAVLVSVIVIAVAHLVFRKRLAAPSCRLQWQVALIAVIAVGGSAVEVARYEDPEGSQEVVRDIVVEDLRRGTGGEIHIFDPRHDRAPHYRLPPSTYWYLASESRFHLQLHGDEPSDWERIVIAPHGRFLAIVPLDWMKRPLLATADVTPLMKIADTQLVFLRSLVPSEVLVPGK